VVQEREGIEIGLDSAGIEAGLRRLAELARGKEASYKCGLKSIGR